MSDQRIFLSELSDRDDFVLASAAEAPTLHTRRETASPSAPRRDRHKPNNSWRAYLEKRQA